MTRTKERDFNLLRSLEIFVAVAESGHITAAANLLGLTQSAASQQISTLERAFGLALIDRSVRPVELTAAGITLHRHAARLIANIEMLRAEVRRAAGRPRPILRVGMLASIGTTLTPGLIRLARDQLCIGELALHAGTASDHQVLLVNRQVDVTVTSEAFYDVDGLERFAVLREPFYLVVPAGGPAVEMNFTHLMKALPLVRFSAATPVGQRIEQHLRRVRLELPRGLEADRASMVIAAVAAGEGYAFLSPSLLVDGIMQGYRIAVRPMPVTPLYRNLTVVVRAGDLGDLPPMLAEVLADEMRLAYETHVNPLLPDGGSAIVYGTAAAQ